MDDKLFPDLRTFVDELRRGGDLVVVDAPVQARLESWQVEKMPTCIISRAFANLTGFVEASRHLAAGDTMLLAMKGKYPETEMEALPDWARVHSVEKLHVPGLQEDRHLVIMSIKQIS